MDNTVIKFLHTSLSAYMHTFLLSIYQKIELLGYRFCVCSTLVDMSNGFSEVVLAIYTTTSSLRTSPLFYILDNI